jgi:EmrB/QacA subfamily drug resistance transporter
VRLGEPTGRWVLTAAVLATSMAMLDSTVVNVALPSLGRDLGATVAGLQWTVTGYVLTLAAFLLLGGSLGDRFGRRRVFVIGVLWFTVASMLCAAAPSIGFLVGARALQGMGGALMTPGSLALLAATLHPDDQGRAIGAWAGLGAAATALGPLLGGWLVSTLSWRWVFWINVPSAVVVVLVALRHIPESDNPSAARRIDLPGAMLGALGLGGVTYALIAVPDRGASPLVLTCAVLGIAALVGFLVTERRTREPMVPLSIFASVGFRVVNLVTFFVYAAHGVLMVFLVLTLQQQAGFVPAAAGSATIPFTVIMFAFSARMGALGQRVGPRVPMTVGPLLVAVGDLVLTRVSRDTSYVTDVLPGVILLGVGMTATVAPLTATALASVPSGTSGVASGINNAVARTAGLLAVAVAPLLVGLRGEQYQDPVAVGRAFDRAMVLCAALTVVGALTSFAGLRPDRRAPREPERQQPPRRLRKEERHDLPAGSVATIGGPGGICPERLGPALAPVGGAGVDTDAAALGVRTAVEERVHPEERRHLPGDERRGRQDPGAEQG